MPREHIPAEVERRVRAAARNRCGYCLSPQQLVMARLEIEHIVPLARGGTSDEDNLVLGDDPDAIEVRSYWVLAGWHPPVS